jgi:hypothetical protein
MLKANPGQSLQDEVGSSVRLLNARANEAQSTDPAGRPFWIIHGDRKHPGAFKGLAQHFAIPGLKNVEGKQVVGEKDRLGQNHYPHLFGKSHTLSPYS